MNKETFDNDEDRALFYHRLIEIMKHSYYQRSLLGDENIEKMDEVINFFKINPYLILLLIFILIFSIFKDSETIIK